MRVIDYILSWLLVIAGTANLLSRWVPALHWFGPVLLAGSGFAVLMLGLINVATLRVGDKLIHWSSIICNVLGAIYAVRFLWTFHTISLRAPVPLTMTCVIGALTVLSIIE